MAIRADSLLPLDAYARQRLLQRAGIIRYRRERSLTLGPAMRLQFEDEHTVRHLVQELLRIERIDDPQEVQRQLDGVAHLLPQPGQWKATLLIELPDRAQRDRDMALLSEAVHRLYLQCRGFARVPVQANEDLADRHRGRPAGVHFLRFELPRPLCEALRNGARISLGCAHPGYDWQRALARPLLQHLSAHLHAPRPSAGRGRARASQAAEAQPT